MGDSLFIDNSIQAAKNALDGLSMQQQLISRNMANIDTPGYRAQTINFEDVLKRVYEKNDTLPMARSNAAHLASPTQAAGYSVSYRPGGSMRADQNNVDVDVELADMSEVGIQYQAISQALAKKYEILKNIAR